MAVAGAWSGEEALDGAFEAGQALGQRLDIFAKSSHVPTNFRTEVLHVGAHLSSERRHVGTGICALALVVGAELGSQGLAVGARIAPERKQQANDGRAYGEDSDEFRGHGRLPGVGLILRRPCELNGNTDHGAKHTLASQWLMGRTRDFIALNVERG